MPTEVVLPMIVSRALLTIGPPAYIENFAERRTQTPKLQRCSWFGRELPYEMDTGNNVACFWSNIIAPLHMFFMCFFAIQRWKMIVERCL